MYIFKHPGIGGEVGWHQDATYLHTTPITVTGFWFALDDADRDNGCLLALPGAHRGPLRKRFRRSGETMAMDELDATPWPAVEPVPIEVRRGIAGRAAWPVAALQQRQPLVSAAPCLYATSDRRPRVV